MSFLEFYLMMWVWTLINKSLGKEFEYLLEMEPKYQQTLRETIKSNNEKGLFNSGMYNFAWILVWLSIIFVGPFLAPIFFTSFSNKEFLSMG